MRILYELMTAILFVGSLGMTAGLLVVVTAVVSTATVPVPLFEMLYRSILVTAFGYLGTLVVSRIRLSRSPLSW